MPDTIRYFPAKPDDVTCQTCPYAVPGSHCNRRETEQPGRISNWCGEHPWFVAERVRQEVIVRCDLRRYGVQNA